jgi:TonB family protein
MKKIVSLFLFSAMCIPVFISGSVLSQDLQKPYKNPSPNHTPVGNYDTVIHGFIPVDKEPIPVELVKPVYPLGAMNCNIQGNVYVKVLLDETGKPKVAQVIKSSNYIFHDSAVSAALNSRFKPAIKDGKNISYWVVIPYKFSNRSIAGQAKTTSE